MRERGGKLPTPNVRLANGEVERASLAHSGPMHTCGP